MESNSLGVGYYNRRGSVSKPMQSVVPVQQQDSSCYGFSVAGVNTNNASGVGGQRWGSAQLEQVQDNFNSAGVIQERSTSLLDISTLFMTPEASHGNQSANSGSQDSDTVFTSGMNQLLPISSTDELINLNQTTEKKDVSCYSIGEGVLTSRSQSFSSLPSYQTQESTRSMTSMLVSFGSGNANTMQGVENDHGHDSFGRYMSEFVDSSVQSLDPHLNQVLKKEDASNYTASQDIPGIKRPHELAVADELQREVRSYPKKSKVEKKQQDVIVVDEQHLDKIRAEIPCLNPKDLAKVSFHLKKQGDIPRPRNSFLIFSNWLRERFIFSDDADIWEPFQSDLCKLFGTIWKRLDANQQGVFKTAATIERNEHGIQFSDYKYQPKRRGATIAEPTSIIPPSKSIEPLKISVKKKHTAIPSAAAGFDPVSKTVGESDRTSIDKGGATTRTTAVNEESMQLINSPSWDKLAKLCCIEDDLTSRCKERILEAAINKIEEFETLVEFFKEMDTP